MYFDSKATDTKKIFTIKFPYEVIFSLKWPKEDMDLLNIYENSDLISEKLTMLAMIAHKIEARGGDESDNSKELVTA